jgi:crotonobetainyl-CoA:carnitine CoA-transferase CaiB-like acyl-CoA transferase
MQLLGLDANRHLPGIVRAVDPTASIRSKDPFLGDDKAFCATILRNKDARRQLIRELGQLFILRTAVEWEPILREQDVWHHTVSDVNDVINDAQANSIGTFVEVGDEKHLCSLSFISLSPPSPSLLPLLSLSSPSPLPLSSLVNSLPTLISHRTLLAHPYLAHLTLIHYHLITQVGAEYPLLSHPVKWGAARAEPRGRAPALGADTEAVLRALGGSGRAKL